jgi:hypothetical protein
MSASIRVGCGKKIPNASMVSGIADKNIAAFHGGVWEAD